MEVCNIRKVREREREKKAFAILSDVFLWSSECEGQRRQITQPRKKIVSKKIFSEKESVKTSLLFFVDVGKLLVLENCQKY